MGYIDCYGKRRRRRRRRRSQSLEEVSLDGAEDVAGCRHVMMCLGVNG